MEYRKAWAKATPYRLEIDAGGFRFSSRIIRRNDVHEANEYPYEHGCVESRDKYQQIAHELLRVLLWRC